MNCNGATRYYVLAGSTITLAGATPPEVFALNGPVVVDAVLDGTEGARFSAQNSGGTPSIYLNAANTYSGNTEIALDGATKIGIVDAIPHGSGKGNVVLSDRGGNAHGYGTLDLLTNTITINGLSGAGGTVTTSSADAGTSTLTVGDNDATATFSGVINDGASGRQLALTKTGSGVQILTGVNGYTGATTVNGGTLAINGTISSPVTVYGGVLGGTGTLYGTVAVGAGGSVGAGTSAGKLTVAMGLDLSAGGTNIWELAANSDSNPGVDFDQIVQNSGTLDLTDSTLIVSLIGSVNTGDVFWNSSHTWTVINSPFALAGSSNFKTIEVVGGTPPGNCTTANNGSAVTLTFTPGVVPFKPPRVKLTSVVPNSPSPTSVTVTYTNTVSGTNYVLQYRTDVNTGAWTSVKTNAAAGTTSSSTDTTTTGSARRFYRVYGQF